MAKYGYLRVSTKDQNLDRQIAAMHEVGIEDINMFQDKMSGKNFERTEYKWMLEVLKEGDVVYIMSIDRLGRNYEEIIQQWTYITKEAMIVLAHRNLWIKSKIHETGRRNFIE